MSILDVGIAATILLAIIVVLDVTKDRRARRPRGGEVLPSEPSSDSVPVWLDMRPWECPGYLIPATLTHRVFDADSTVTLCCNQSVDAVFARGDRYRITYEEAGS